MAGFDQMNPLLASRIQALIAAAQQAGFSISPGSGFRSREEQAKLYRDYVNGVPGQAKAAPPGRSHHEFGLAMDLHYGSKAAAKWANSHAAQFGLAFPVGGENWHVELAGDGESAGFMQGAQQMGAMAGADIGTQANPEQRQDELLQSYMDVITGAQRDALLGTPAADLVSTPEAAVSGPDMMTDTATLPDTALRTETTTIPGQQGQGQGQPAAGFEGSVPPIGYAPPGKGADRWRPVAVAALRYTGQNPTPQLVDLMIRRINQESGGNPTAINNWDSNAKRGDPSIGLMQNIGSAFPTRARELANRGIYDGFANMVAAIRYSLQRYGSLDKAWNRPGGY